MRKRPRKAGRASWSCSRRRWRRVQGSWLMKKAFFWISLALPIVAAAWSVPMQLGLQVPFEPTVFTGAGRETVMYELHLTNFSDKAIDLRRIEVFDAGG